MTRDHARKKAIRARMDASGESYSVAARKLGAADDPAAAGAIIVARVNSTLASPGARIELRTDWGSRWGREHRPGRVGRMATFAARAVVKRISPETDLASVGEKLAGALGHLTGEGFIEPAADRYQIDYGKMSVMRFDGQHYRGVPGELLEAKDRREEFMGAPLELVRKLRDVTDARLAGQETVRGTLCQIITARADATEFTVWIDEEHIRRVQAKERGSGERIELTLTKTLELWDFGTEDVPADWTHLPSFRPARKITVTR